MVFLGAAILGVRLFLSGVFLVAGTAKLFDRAGSRQALLDFGAPPWLASPLGALVPLAELTTAVALLVPAAGRWGALAAAALLLLFTAVIAAALARGRAPACRCFGQLSAAPVGPRTLARNGILAAGAVFLVWGGWNDPGPSVPSALAAMAVPGRLAAVGTVGGLALGVAVVLLMVQMLRQQGRILLRLESLEQFVASGQTGQTLSTAVAPPPAGLPVGTPAPSFRLRDLEGAVMDLPGFLGKGRPVLLLFVHPRCGPCEALMPAIAGWQQRAAGVLSMPLISEGSARENRVMAEQHGLETVLRQRASEVANLYQAYGTPSAVLVAADGTIASSVASGADAIRALVESALTAPALGWDARLPSLGTPNGHAAPASTQPAGLRPGDTAPRFTLERLDGRLFRLQESDGAERLLVSWNPSCGFCQQLLEPLKTWETRVPRSTLKLVILAQGDSTAMAAAGFRSLVVIDNDGSASRAFGMTGTPMAVLVAADGRVASEILVGGEAILQAANSRVGASGS
jgi:thiol-disulfide isomerase/thioredoxin/uncharacterized membrane protein YphA (DoxX/SURF4 family)